MRPISLTKLVVALLPARTENLRVEVMDAGAIWRDLSTYAPGFDAQVSASWGENADDPHVTAKVLVRREQNKLSLSPFMSDSPFNRTFNPSTAYAPLIALNREFRISVAVMGIDQTPVSGDWEVVFHGRIDDYDLASGDGIAISGRDLGGLLANTFIEDERVYGLADDGLGNPVSLRIWAPSTVYPLLTYIIPTEAQRNVAGVPRYYQLTTASGATGTTEPVWPTGGTVADGLNVWTLAGATSPDVGFPIEQVIQNILNDWAPGVTLYVPPSTPFPAFDVTQWLQTRVSVMEAIRELTLLYGGDIRYKWRAATSQFELTLIDPDRAKIGVDYTFTNADYEDISSLKSEISGVRNAWQGVYSDAADKDAGGRPKRKSILVTDTTSINKYGRLFAEIAEDEASQIDSAAEMTRMLDSALADTKEPKVEQEIQLVFGFPWVELNDLYRFTANGRHYSADQDLAVFSYQHEAVEGKIRTTISTRGQPSAGFERWHMATTRNHRSKNQLQVFESAAGITYTATSVPNGATLTIVASPERMANGEEYEFHISLSSGFVPSSATLVQSGKQRQCELTNLSPGTLYYTKIVPLTRDGTKVVRGLPSAEVSFVAGYVQVRSFQPQVNVHTIPVNCDFEANNIVGDPPDKWSFSGTWGSHAEIIANLSMSGGKSVKFNGNATSSHVLSSELVPFRMHTDTRLKIRCYIRQSNATTVATSYMVARINLYDNTFASLTTSSLIMANPTASAWIKNEFSFDVEDYIATYPTACFLGVELYRNQTAADSYTYHVDRVEIIDVSDTNGFFWVTPTLASGWSQYASYQAVRYRRLMIGGAEFVYGEGLVQNTSGGVKSPGATTIYTLAAAYRPSLPAMVAAISNSVGTLDLARISITTAGVVQFEEGVGIPNGGWINVQFWFGKG